MTDDIKVLAPMPFDEMLQVMEAFLVAGRVLDRKADKDTPLSVLEFDSLEVVAVVLALETRYEVFLDFEDTTLDETTTLGALHSMLVELTASR